MTNRKKHIRRLLAALCAAALLLLCGCQPTPESEAVTSKNDGAFQAALQSTAEPAAEDGADSMAEAADAETYTASFATTDGSVAYTASLSVPAADTALPVLRVTPEEIPAETVEQIARAFFDSGNIYEYSAQKTKTEIQEAILSLKLRQAELASTENYSGNDLEETQILLEEYEAEYASAPDTAEPTLCAFAYRDASDYGQANSNGWDVAQMICCTGQRNGLTYTLKSQYYRSGESQISNVGVDIDDETLSTLYAAATAEPTEEDVAAAVEQTRDFLDAAGLGEWDISAEVYAADASVFEELDMDSGTLYFINLTAAPMYNGLAVTRHPFAENREVVWYSNDYADTEITFCFIAGELADFTYQSPVSVVEETNENVQTLTFDEIMEKLQTYLSLRDASYYTTHTFDGCLFTEGSRASVTVDSVVLGLGRIQVQDSATDYYLVPTYTFCGSVSMFDESGNQLPYYDENGGGPDGTVGAMDAELAIINAVDGSIITVAKGD